MAKILVVDDNGSVRDVIRMTLEDEGYSVLEAADADQAIALMRSSSEPLVVLLDLHLTDRGGNSVLRAIEADLTLTARNRVILLSASTAKEAEEAMDSLKGTLAGYIRKPFDLPALIESVAATAATLGTLG